MTAALQARLKRLEVAARVDQPPLVLVVPPGEPVPSVASDGRPVFFVVTGIPRPMEVSA